VPTSAPYATPAKTLLIVYHTMTGGSLQMAQAARAGAAAVAGLQVRLLPAAQAGPADVLAADGYLFVTPENLAAMAGAMKDFFDRSYYPVLERVNGRPYAALVCAGSDGSNAVRQLERICTGWRLNKVAETLIVCTHAQTPEAILAPKTIAEGELQRCRDLGEALASGLAMGIF
jgi:multimeric flavodoxin WrbA